MNGRRRAFAWTASGRLVIGRVWRGGGAAPAGQRRWPRRAALGAVGLGVVLGLIATDVGALTPSTAPLRPSTAQVALTMWRTILAADPLEHFYPGGPPATISDGSAGDLTAAVGVVQPSTDGDGQLVFFWHDNRFVGWDAPQDAMVVMQLQPLRGEGFRVTYGNYAPNDPACCPSLIPLTVTYRWNGHQFVAEGELPLYTPIPSQVRLIR